MKICQYFKFHNAIKQSAKTFQILKNANTYIRIFHFELPLPTFVGLQITYYKQEMIRTGNTKIKYPT